MKTDPLKILHCEPWIAQALARDIDSGKADPCTYIGESFADFQGREVARQINAGKGDADAMCQLLIAPELASAIAKAINAKTGHLS